MAIVVNLDVMLARRKMTLCDALECQPGDLLEYVPEEKAP